MFILHQLRVTLTILFLEKLQSKMVQARLRLRYCNFKKLAMPVQLNQIFFLKHFKIIFPTSDVEKKPGKPLLERFI